MVSMSDAEFRMVRESLGLDGDDLATRLGVSLRTIRRWEHGHSTIPDGVHDEMRALVELADLMGEALVRGARDPGVLIIPRGSGWWRAVAAKCVAARPGTRVRYRD